MRFDIKFLSTAIIIGGLTLAALGLFVTQAQAITYGKLQEAIVADGYRCDGIVKVYRGYPRNRMVVVCIVMGYKKIYNVEFFNGRTFIVPAK